jgi:hypothetical protein
MSARKVRDTDYEDYQGESSNPRPFYSSNFTSELFKVSVSNIGL